MKHLTLGNGIFLNGRKLGNDVASELHDGDLLNLLPGNSPVKLNYTVKIQRGENQQTNANNDEDITQELCVPAGIAISDDDADVKVEFDTDGSPPQKRRTGLRSPQGSDASLALVKSKLLEQLQCQVCLCVLEQPMSIQPCGHTFCAHCLHDTFAPAARSWEGKLVCPACRAICTGLNKNFVIQNLKATLMEDGDLPQGIDLYVDASAADKTARLDKEALMARVVANTTPNTTFVAKLRAELQGGAPQNSAFSFRPGGVNSHISRLAWSSEPDDSEDYSEEEDDSASDEGGLVDEYFPPGDPTQPRTLTTFNRRAADAMRDPLADCITEDFLNPAWDPSGMARPPSDLLVARAEAAVRANDGSETATAHNFILAAPTWALSWKLSFSSPHYSTLREFDEKIKRELSQLAPYATLEEAVQLLCFPGFLDVTGQGELQGISRPSIQTMTVTNIQPHIPNNHPHLRSDLKAGMMFRPRHPEFPRHTPMSGRPYGIWLPSADPTAAPPPSSPSLIRVTDVAGLLVTQRAHPQRCSSCVDGTCKFGTFHLDRCLCERRDSEYDSSITLLPASQRGEWVTSIGKSIVCCTFCRYVTTKAAYDYFINNNMNNNNMNNTSSNTAGCCVRPLGCPSGCITDQTYNPPPCVANHPVPQVHLEDLRACLAHAGADVKTILLDHIRSAAAAPNGGVYVPAEFNKSLAPVPGGLVTPLSAAQLADLENLPCCVKCMNALIVKAVSDWMLKNPNVMPPAVADKQQCWYGLECRTASHNPSHAHRLRHYGPNTRGQR